MPTINETATLRFYLDTQEYSDRLAAIEAQASSSLATQQTEVAAAVAQVNLTQSQTITALTLEVSNLKTDLTNSITATQTDLINRADELAQDVTDITQQLTQDKATFTQEIQDALDYLKDDASVASALRTPRKIQGVEFDGTQDINLPTFTTQTDGLVPKRVGAGTTKYLREDGTWVTPTNTTYTELAAATANDGTETTAKLISASVLKVAIQTHAPTTTTITGNAGSATKLETARKINGIDFDGTADINLDVYNKSAVDTAIANATPTIPNATETTAGKAEIATQVETYVATDDTRFVTPKKFLAGLKYHLNAAGVAPMFACRAWVNFNGVGVVSVIASGNVSSVTDNGVGDYTLNFAIPMPNANYSISSGSPEASDGTPTVLSLRMSGITPLLKSISAVRVSVRSTTNSVFFDTNNISVQVFC